MIHSVNISLDSEHSGLECTRPATSLHLGLDGAAQFGCVLGVTLAVDQHQRNPLVVLDDVGHAAEILRKKKESWDEKFFEIILKKTRLKLTFS